MTAPVGADIGVVGLATMGKNLVLNLNDHGFSVVVYNRTLSKMDEFLSSEAVGTRVSGARDLQGLAAALQVPRRVLLMIQAGPAVDAVIQQLATFLEPGDIIIDGGNSHPTDTERRVDELAKLGIYFVGAGISGGEEGARFGPSIMPGGHKAAWPSIGPILQAIAAKASDGTPCCEWIGPGGSGHFVKMVHNGIEYGDMQLIAEAYDLMRYGLNLHIRRVEEVFREWNKGALQSFLIQITADILAARNENGEPVLDTILDAAGQKGTGRWTVTSAMDLGAPLTLVGEAVFARTLSAHKDERAKSSVMLGGNLASVPADELSILRDLELALFASKLVSYTQGFLLLSATRQSLGWNLHCGRIALLWREGCIIRSAFLSKINDAYAKQPDISNLLLDDFFLDVMHKAQEGWRNVVVHAFKLGLPMPAMASALSFYDGLRRNYLPANLIQAQRDFFGAHSYERVDRPRGEFFHTLWSQAGAPTLPLSPTDQP